MLIQSDPRNAEPRRLEDRCDLSTAAGPNVDYRTILNASATLYEETGCIVRSP